MSRDPRYTKAKEISEVAPKWSHGCVSCKHGIKFAPELTRITDLYLERAVQHMDGAITYCDCQAGTSHRVSILNRIQWLIEEARRDPRMAAFREDNSHPDLESAARLVHTAQNYDAIPTIHGA